MANIKQAYAALSAATQITSASIASLGNGNSWCSSFVDNTVNDYLDYLIVIQTVGQASGTSTLDLFAVGSIDGTLWTDNVTSDASVTSAAALNRRYIGSVNMSTTTTVVGGPFSLAQAFGGYIPNKWAILFTNNSGAALGTTQAVHRLSYQGVYATSV